MIEKPVGQSKRRLMSTIFSLVVRGPDPRIHAD
jgi:hypothetical protein